MINHRDRDVVVIGAGTSGAAAALHCARRGMDVLCIDRRPLDRAGARWVNNIPAWMFRAAAIAPPEPPERLGDPSPLHLFAGYGPERIVIGEHDCLEVDMRLLTERLRREARAEGAHFASEVDVRGFDGEALFTSEGDLRARFYVDASGLGGAGLVGLPRPARQDICAAAQQVRHITDENRARRFFREQAVPYGDTLCYGGLDGGYSVLHLRAHGADRIHILTGSLPGRGHRSGPRMLDDFVHRHRDWIGDELYGGSAPIPLGRPADRLAQGRVAVIGDACMQVLSAHGSGVGAGLVAAEILADSLAAGRGVSGYAVRWQRRYGGTFAAYDLFRRFSAELSASDMAVMMQSGLLHPHLAGLSLRQLAPLPRRPILANPAALRRAPHLLPSLGATLAKMLRVALLYRRYPADEGRVSEWAMKVEQASGPRR